jgi:hypothetical protein
MTIEDRINSLIDKKGAVHKAFPSVSNDAIWYKNLLTQPVEIADMLLLAVEVADAALATEIANTEYIRLRKAAYPPLSEQLDTIYHEGIEAWKAEIQAIKTMYPKPVVE